MQRPIHAGSETSPWSAGRIGGFAFATLLNGILAYALFSGLATRIVEQIPQVIHTEIVRPQPPPQQELAPPSPEFQTPSLPQVPQPVIRIETPPAPSNAIHAVAVPHPVQPVAPNPVQPAAPRPASAVAGTHTTPPYPPISRRLGEEGTVILRITIGADGRITQVEIAQSSGSARLDEAAREWVAAHWRYHPATQNGRPVATTVKAAVKFDLRDAR